jgi:hypothetical protein
MHAGRAMLFVVREAELLLVGGPIAVIGAIAHALPYQAVAAVARTLSKERDEWASNAIFPAFVVFPAWYAVVIGTVWWRLPTFWALLATVALPYTGYYALLYRDRATLVWRRLRAFLHFLFHRESQERLAAEGRDLLERMRDLGQSLRAGAL